MPLIRTLTLAELRTPFVWHSMSQFGLSAGVLIIFIKKTELFK